jgi:signal transduction histidine kinase
MQFHIWDFLSTEGFQPHGFCLLWRPDVFWAHVIADGVIALSYFSIPAALIYLATRRRDLTYRWVFYLFGAFIVACGLTHAFGIWTLWVPDYGVQAILKSVTAAISVITAISLWPLMPRLLAMPSASQLADKNAALAREVAEREAAEKQLQSLNAELERRVAERTESLERVNRKLLESRAVAEQANNAKSEFLANMSHELRTPLNAIIGFSDIIRTEDRTPASGSSHREYADHIHDSVHHLLNLVNDILDLSKIESGVEQMHEEEVDVAALAKGTIELLKSAAQQGGVEFTFDAPHPCPPLLADERKLKQIFLNLLSNAMKFTPDGGRVSLALRPDADEGYVIVVSDNGIGMTQADLARAFTPFQQVDSYLSRKHTGTGLGLPLALALTEMHGGSLEVVSDLGTGTTVTLCFSRDGIPAQRIAESTVGTAICRAPSTRSCSWRRGDGPSPCRASGPAPRQASKAEDINLPDQRPGWLS